MQKEQCPQPFLGIEAVPIVADIQNTADGDRRRKDSARLYIRVHIAGAKITIRPPLQDNLPLMLKPLSWFLNASSPKCFARPRLRQLRAVTRSMTLNNLVMAFFSVKVLMQLRHHLPFRLFGLSLLDHCEDWQVDRPFAMTGASWIRPKDAMLRFGCFLKIQQYDSLPV